MPHVVSLGPGLAWLNSDAYRRMRWKNGAGWTTEIAARPEGASEFEWRVSIAEVDADAEFSPFPGIDRSILVLAGEGMELQVEGAAPATLRAEGPAHAFAGETPARARLLGGPTRDFNAMTRRGRYTHLLARRPLTGGLALDRGPDVAWLVHVLRGEALAGGRAIAAGDSLLFDHVSEDMSPGTLGGEGEVVLVRLQRAGASAA